ncbi:hypothetical protein [Streptomyces sp. NPDC000410]|uniref:hypothetical protein n=1 Tax=Streptomyces sp. NPDC000410 TaxID=3154254 RepID=UPI003322F6D0
MRKLRKAALVAAMVGSVSMFGAGVASAAGDGGDTEVIYCEAKVNNVSVGLVNIPNLSLGLLFGDANPATTNAVQQTCGEDNLSGQAAGANSGSGSVLDGLLGGGS